MRARNPVSQRTTQGPRDIRKRKEVAECGRSDAGGQIGAQMFPERRTLQPWSRSEQITDRFRDPNVTFKIRLVH